MARTPPLLDLSSFSSQLNASGDNAPSIDEKLQLCESIRGYSRESARQLDRFLLEQLTALNSGLSEAKESQQKLQELLGKLTEPPWHPAIFLGLAPTERGDAAVVLYGNSRRVVMLADIDPECLAVGDEVLLGSELNLIVAKSPFGCYEYGETAIFDRYTPDGRAVIKSRDEELILKLCGALEGTDLRSGDGIRWERNAWLALEKIDRSKGEGLFLEETPSETFESVGGLSREIGQLQESVLLHLNHSGVAAKYRLPRKGSVLLVGPPGVGKTMLARAFANFLSRLSRSGRCRFMNIKPSALNSMWFSQSEANYREAFRVARDAGEGEPDVPVVMFIDEIDSVGATRGDALMQVNDRVMTALATELDGLESRGNVLVVAATNRRDALDPAMLRPGRLGDQVIDVPRPNMKAARDIFGKYLQADIPYSDDLSGGRDLGAIRADLIESAVSRIYSPNGQSNLATITFRDGKTRVVRARDLISGASIRKMVQAAKESACMRELKTGDTGIKLQDVLVAIDEECETVGRVLTPVNCHNHLSDLPQDLSVARVEPVQRKVSRSYRYLSVA